MKKTALNGKKNPVILGNLRGKLGGDHVPGERGLDNFLCWACDRAKRSPPPNHPVFQRSHGSEALVSFYKCVGIRSPPLDSVGRDRRLLLPPRRGAMFPPKHRATAGPPGQGSVWNPAIRKTKVKPSKLNVEVSEKPSWK